jgi:hypothetical protein
MIDSPYPNPYKRPDGKICLPSVDLHTLVRNRLLRDESEIVAHVISRNFRDSCAVYTVVSKFATVEIVESR